MRGFSIKRGQIALFVIIAIILVAAIVLLYTFRQSVFKPVLSSEDAQKLVSAQIQPVRDYITGCFKISARKTLNTMGRQGGHFLPRGERVSIPGSVMPDAPFVSYALMYDSSSGGYVNQLASLNEMKGDFADWMQSNLEFGQCINQFSAFSQILDVQGAYNLTIDRKNLDFGETSGQIVIPFTYPVKISKQNATTLVDNYVVKIPINMARIRETSARITNSFVTGENYMQIIKDEGEIEWDQLRSDSASERMLISSAAYSDIPSALSGSTNNNKNLLFKIEYQRPDLDVPFDYYLLIGTS